MAAPASAADESAIGERLDALARAGLAGARNRLTRGEHGLEFIGETHAAGASSLIIRATDDAPIVRWVLFFADAGEPVVWRYPDGDPGLPELAGFVESAITLAPADWSWTDSRDARVTRTFIRRVPVSGYNPAERAVFILDTTAGEPAYVLKLFAAARFPAVLARHIALAGSSLPDRVRLPRMVAFSERRAAILHAFLTGEPLGSSPPPGLEDWIVTEAAAILAAVHGTEVPGLTAWTGTKDPRELRAAADLVRHARPEVAEVASPLAERLASVLDRRSWVRTTTAHLTFRPRHLLLDRPAGRPPVLAVIDWDSVAIGPPERDLASFIAGLPSLDEAAFLERYQERVGWPVDRSLVDAFIAARSLVRACRRAVSPGRSTATALRPFGELTEMVERLERE